MKLRFPKQVYVNGEVFAKEGEIKDVPEEKGSAARWIKRGAIPVKDDEEIIEEEIIEGPKDVDEDESEVVDLEKATKKVLLKYAADNKIEIPKECKKVEEIREFLLSSREEDAVEDAF